MFEMSLSVELLKRLNTNEEPLSKRLKLAENVFCAINVPIIHKDDLILQWLCRMSTMDQNVWNSLKNCLKIKYLNIKNSIIKILIQILIETFQQNVKHIHQDVFECCSLLTSNNRIQQYFINKPEDLGLLTKSLLECTNQIFKYTFNIKESSKEGIKVLLINKSDGLILIVYDTVITVIESIIQIYKSAFVAKDNLKTIFIHNILYPLCDIIDLNCTDNTNRLGSVAHKCIQQLIFGKKHIQSTELLRNEDATCFNNLLSILKENSKVKDFDSNLKTFTFLFRVAISTFRSNTIQLDIILRELVECSGMYRKKMMSILLQCAKDIRLDFDNKVDDVTLFDYCQNIIDDILISKNMSSTSYDLLVQFCYFNPLVIEKRIHDILKKLFVEKSILKHRYVMVSILDAAIYLRQEEKLISVILITLKDCLYHISRVENDMFFSNEFKKKLTEAVNNITNSQIVVILRTLTYHLKTDCLEILQSTNTSKNILMLQAIVELLITVLNGICIFEYSGSSPSYKKFIISFDDLKNVLIFLMDKSLYLNHNEEIMILLTAIFAWNETQRTLKYYVLSTTSEDLGLPLSENQWQQLIKKVKEFHNENYKNHMNKLILQQTKMLQNRLCKSMMLKNLIGDLEHCWSIILKFNTEIISSLSNKQVLKLTHLLLTDMISNVDNFNEWVNALHKNDLQENKRLIIFLLTCVFTQIGHLVTEGVTNSITKYFNAELLFEAEIGKCEEINNILMSIKEKLLINKWTQTQNALFCKIRTCLEVLLHLPLIFLSTNLRLITFLFIFTLQMECNQCNEVVFLCNTIFSDLLEKSNLDVFQYIDPFILLQLIPQNKTFQKILEPFFMDCSYKSLKKCIRSSTHSNRNIFLLLKSMEHIKTKLSTNQKTIIKKAEEKLMKIIIKNISFNETDDIKILYLILKVSIKNENIDEKLKKVAESTIQEIFMNDQNKIGNELLQDGLQLVVVILRNKKLFQITNHTTRAIWSTLFKYPYVDALSPLLESSEPNEFSEFVEELHNRLVKALLNAHESDLENICIIWNVILKISMSSDRNRLRVTAINNLIQTMHTINILEKFWPTVLKLIQNIFATKHLYLPGYVIDMSIILGLKSLKEDKILICSDTLAFCSVLLKVKTHLIRDRIPSLLIIYRQILNIFVHKSKFVINKFDEQRFKCLALDIERFTSSLIKFKKDMIRISPYLIAYLLELFLEISIPKFIKVSLQNCINQLISICDQHGIALLSRTLPVSLQEIFKTQLNIYNRFYKFIGKI